MGHVRRRIGILGGMGPEATVLLMQRLIAAVPAHDDSDHIPLIVDQNPQVPSRLRRLIEGTGEDPGPVLAEMAHRLQSAGAEALAMPCNTAHHYAPVIRAATDVPLLDMVELSATRARELAGHGGSIGILASPAVRHTGLFESAFAAKGLHLVYIEDDAIPVSIIRHIKANRARDEAVAGLTALSQDLLARGAVVQMIGCTEFSLIPDAVAPEARAFDTLDCLVEAIIEFSATDPEA